MLGSQNSLIKKILSEINLTILPRMSTVRIRIALNTLLYH